MSTISGHTSRASGTILTSAIYNADHTNHVTNAQNLNADKIEGATGPVVDGHGVLFDGTSGAAFKTAGYVPANAARTITVGSGLTGGGDLTSNMTIDGDLASQAEAEAGADNTVLMTPLRAAQYAATLFASQAEAEAGTDNTVLMTPLRTEQYVDARLASQATAEAGSDNNDLMTALRTAQAIAALASSINVGTTQSVDDAAPWDSGVSAATGGMFIVYGSGNTDIGRVSLDGGSTFTDVTQNPATGDEIVALVIVKGTRVVSMSLFKDVSTAVTEIGVIDTTATGGGNIVFDATGGNNVNVVQLI